MLLGQGRGEQPCTEAALLFLSRGGKPARPSLGGRMCSCIHVSKGKEKANLENL